MKVMPLKKLGLPHLILARDVIPGQFTIDGLVVDVDTSPGEVTLFYRLGTVNMAPDQEVQVFAQMVKELIDTSVTQIKMDIMRGW